MSRPLDNDMARYRAAGRAFLQFHLGCWNKNGSLPQNGNNAGEILSVSSQEQLKRNFGSVFI